MTGFVASAAVFCFILGSILCGLFRNPRANAIGEVALHGSVVLAITLTVALIAGVK